MRWEEWKFSAKLAWQDLFFRWTVLASAIAYLGTTAFLMWRLVPEGWRTGVLTVHYNVYLGIDDVRSWTAVFLFPSLACVFFVTDSVLACALFRRDELAAKTLLVVGFAAILVWMIGMFFLIRVNG